MHPAYATSVPFADMLDKWVTLQLFCQVVKTLG